MSIPTSMVELYDLWIRGRALVFTALVRRDFATFGDHSRIQQPAGLTAAPHMSVGRGVALGPHCRFLVGGSLERGDVLIHIGDGVSVAGFCTVSAFQSVTIGDRALFARNVYIADHQHAYRDPTRAVRDQGVEQIAPVRIGAGAWLGEGVVIGPGVTVGDGAVVGAHAVVRSDVPAYSLAVGAPARVIHSWSPRSAGPPAAAVLRAVETDRP